MSAPLSTLTYLVGPPGVGKTSIMRAALGLQPDAWRQEPKPSAHAVHTPFHPLVVLGNWSPARRPFDGTDAVAKSDPPLVLAWLAHEADRGLNVAGEGQRFASWGFFAALRPYYTLHIVEVRCAAATWDTRRAARSAEVGKSQNAAWVKGRVTATENISQWAMTHARYTELDTTDKTPLDAVTELAVAYEDPFFSAVLDAAGRSR